MWKIANERRIYQYGGYERAQEVQERAGGVNITADGILLLAILELLKSLSNPEWSGIEGQEI
jgi:hypothetical protein